MYNFERGHSNRRSKHNAVFSWNCPKLLVQAFVLFRDSFRDWQPKMLQTCTHAMEISTTNMRTNISFCFPCFVFIWRYLNDVIGCYMYNVLIRYIYIMISCYYSKYHVDVLYIYIYIVGVATKHMYTSYVVTHATTTQPVSRCYGFSICKFNQFSLEQCSPRTCCVLKFRDNGVYI